MAAGTDTMQGNYVPLLPANGFVIAQQTASSATDLMTLRRAASASGNSLQVQNSSSSNVFNIGSTGMIRQQVLGSLAIASIASNASATYALSGITTADVVSLYVTTGHATGNGTLIANCHTADKITVWAMGGSVAAASAAVWYFRTAAG